MMLRVDQKGGPESMNTAKTANDIETRNTLFPYGAGTFRDIMEPARNGIHAK